MMKKVIVVAITSLMLLTISTPAHSFFFDCDWFDEPKPRTVIQKPQIKKSTATPWTEFKKKANVSKPAKIKAPVVEEPKESFWEKIKRGLELEPNVEKTDERTTTVPIE